MKEKPKIRTSGHIQTRTFKNRVVVKDLRTGGFSTFKKGSRHLYIDGKERKTNE